MDSSSNDFEIVIVTYNNALEIKGLLSDIKRFSKNALSRTIIVDNASLDSTALIMKKTFPQVRIIENKANLGYSRAVNQGFGLCKKDYVFLINPDIRIEKQDFWEKLPKIIRGNRHIGAVGPLQFKDLKRKKLNFTWSYLSLKGLRLYFSHLFGLQKHLDRKHFRALFLNCGCLLVRREVFKKVGGLNEKYFLYGEEPDLFLKFKRFGYKSYLCPKAEAVHFREKSFKSISKLKRIKYKIMVVKNITNALIFGFINLLKKPQEDDLNDCLF